MRRISDRCAALVVTIDHARGCAPGTQRGLVANSRPADTAPTYPRPNTQIFIAQRMRELRCVPCRSRPGARSPHGMTRNPDSLAPPRPLLTPCSRAVCRQPESETERVIVAENEGVNRAFYTRS